MNKPLALLIAALCFCDCGALQAEVVVVVSAASPIRALNNTQIADVFLGRVVRLPDAVIAVPVDQALGSPVRDEFYLTMTGKSAAQLKAFWSKLIFTGRGRPPKAVTGNTEVLKIVRENPTAIGYVERQFADVSVRILQ